MEKQTKEQISSLLKAKSLEELASMLEDGAKAERLWAELTRRREANSRDLSLDELEAVSGGAKRDWVRDGCCATVKPGSWCGSNDSCSWFDVTYDRPPTSSKCPLCGTNLYVDNSYSTGPADDIVALRCKNCGYLKCG